MDDLLTTRQLEELLQVDRVTIYRMLNDGRLPGFKVGGQWRFSRQEVDKWLEEQRVTLQVSESLSAAEESPLASDVLPLSCVRVIQAVCAEALDVAAVTTAPDGTPLTEVSNSCELCNRILSTEEGHRRCVASWRLLDSRQRCVVRTCHAGLACIVAPIQVGDEWVANLAACQFAVPPEEVAGQAWRANLPGLAADLGLDEGDLQAAAESVRLLAQAQLPRVSRLLLQVADALSKMGQEQQKLVSRLRRIAEMTGV